MNRREFLPASAALAGAALAGSLPVLVSKKVFAYSIPGWIENSTTTSLENSINPRFSAIKAKESVYALTVDEWNTAANQFQSLADENSRLSNLHKLDLAVIANQAALIKQYGSAPVDDLLKNGSHAAFTNAAAKYHLVADKLQGLSPDLNMTCDKAYAMISAECDMTALLLGEVPPIAIVIALGGVAASIAGIFMCP